MLIYRLGQAEPRRRDTAGATLGQSHMAPLRARLEQPEEAGREQVVVLDYSGIETTTASYIKATALWLLRCGQAAAGVPVQGSATEPSTPIPLCVFPFVTGMNAEVSEELEEVFSGRKLPCLEAVTLGEEGVLTARLRGAPESTVRRTFNILLTAGEATATTMYERHPEERISLTAWNNRLADLYVLRLARREKQGRQWLYIPVIKEVVSG